MWAVLLALPASAEEVHVTSTFIPFPCKARAVAGDILVVNFKAFFLRTEEDITQYDSTYEEDAGSFITD